jgi:hypothetical protein
MPLTFDAKFMAFRLLASPPSSVFETLLGSVRDGPRPDGWRDGADPAAVGMNRTEPAMRVHSAVSSIPAAGLQIPAYHE